jgi:hypothetical protein
MPTPTRAEVNDIYNTLADGADGLVLAAETAIGKYPIQCACMVSKVILAFQRHELDDGQFYPLDAVSLLIEPHGGRLVHREAGTADLNDIERLPRLTVSERELMDCEQLGYGTYSPLTGFMSQETLEAVLDTNHLPSGEVWTLPIPASQIRRHRGLRLEPRRLPTSRNRSRPARLRSTGTISKASPSGCTGQPATIIPASPD